ncbi:MAG: FtsX-like permease family protein, partial [Clostridia bacterium]|nr:FtsX-like permease family protein [Clostridia bacterium]
NNSTFKYFKIVGFYTNKEREEIIVNNDYLANTKKAHGVNCIITKLTGKRTTDYDLAEYLFVGDGNEGMRINGIVWRDIWNSTLSSKYNKDLGLYGTIVAGVFSILMMANFIVTSINNNKKQIGILRALGMRTGGVLYIFMLEALLVGLLSFGLSVASLYIAVAIIGWSKGFAINIQQLFITPVEILSMFGLSLVICILSTIVPIIKKSRVQPINLIKDLK